MREDIAKKIHWTFIIMSSNGLTAFMTLLTIFINFLLSSVYIKI